MKRLTLLCVLAFGLVAALAPTGLLPAEAGRGGELRERPVAAKQPERRRQRARPRLQPFGTRAVELARGMLGVAYRYGGTSPRSGFDCSGFTSYVYSRLGVQLPHNAAAQFGSGRPVRRSRLRPGDLLFFSGLGHVGMYVGGGRMIHAPQSGDVVRVVRLGVDYDGTLVGARRIPQPRLRPPQRDRVAAWTSRRSPRHSTPRSS